MSNSNYIEIPRMNMKSSIFAEFVEKIKELEEENKELKDILKEIKGKLHYINTPKNQHNVFGNDFMKKLDDLFKTENEE